MSYTNKQKAIALIPKVGGTISFLSSLYILQHVLKSPKRRSTLYHRLLAVMSACDMLGSSIFILSTWPIPQESGIYLASGTTQTCTMVGFFNQIAAYATPAYNVSLALYYYLTIVKGYKEDHIAKHYQLYIYAIPIGMGLITAVSGLVLDLFNSANFVCWIAPYPPGCKDSWTFGDEANCERGDNADIYRLAFLYAHLWLFMLLNLYFMVAIYYAVFQQERSIKKYMIRATTKQQQRQQQMEFKHSRRVAFQGALYIIAFYLTFIPGSMTRLRQMVKGKVEFGIIVNMTIFLPLQGFLNMIVYIYPRYRRHREEQRRQQNRQSASSSGNDTNKKSIFMSFKRAFKASAFFDSTTPKTTNVNQEESVDNCDDNCDDNFYDSDNDDDDDDDDDDDSLDSDYRFETKEKPQEYNKQSRQTRQEKQKQQKESPKQQEGATTTKVPDKATKDSTVSSNSSTLDVVEPSEAEITASQFFSQRRESSAKNLEYIMTDL